MAGKYVKINIASTGGGGGGGSSTPPYSYSFTIGTWSLSGSEYSINIPQSTHLKGANPIIQAYELSGSNYIEVLQYIEINGSGDVTLKLNQLPDIRYAGKVIIGD
jgi:hypothetical protein